MTERQRKSQEKRFRVTRLGPIAGLEDAHLKGNPRLGLDRVDGIEDENRSRLLGRRLFAGPRIGTRGVSLKARRRFTEPRLEGYAASVSERLSAWAE